MTYLKLADGAVWPDPICVPDLIHAARYRDLTQTEQHHVAAVLEAYHHILTHPAGTEAIVKQVRQVRRAIR